MVKTKFQKIVFYPLMTEKAVSLIETENKLTFIVDLRAKKNDVKKAFEELYETKISDVNIVITSKGLKKAYIKLHPEFKASDLAIKLGIL